MPKIQTGLFIIIYTFLFTLNSTAQQFEIIAAGDGATLPFATLINHTHPKLVSANASGMANLPVQNGDTIAVSYVGFQTATFIFNATASTTIRLFKESNTLPAVTIQNCKKMKQTKYSNKNGVKLMTNKNGVMYHFTGAQWWGIWGRPTYAVRIDPEKENALLNSFSFWLEKAFFGPVSAIKAPLIISFYDVTDSLLPGHSLTETPLIYYPQKTGKQTLQLDSLQLRIPAKGIYVSFQCVMNEDYAWKQSIKMKDREKDTIIDCYGGTIEGIYSKRFEYAAFSSLKNKWIMFSPDPNGDNNFHGTIKCEAVLKYCADE